MAFVLILFPLAMAGLALIIPSNRWRPLVLPMTALVHSSGTLAVLIRPEWGSRTSWLVLDPVGALILLSVSTLFLFSSFYAVGYLKYRQERSNRIFTACMSAFLGLISLAIWSHHLGLMWVAIEGTTLVTAPLIYFNHSPRSIEATWKYLLVGSVGIALALLGTFFLAYSSMQGGFQATLTFEDLLHNAPGMSKTWLRASFILLLVGYGTKMGLAPMHTWKPDAYGEAPGIVGAIFAGGVTSGAFLALMRIYQICNAAGESLFTSRLLIFMGLFSMAVAGIFMVSQRDFKRMLAYSSVEHMGILVLGLGIGAPALYGTLLHVVTNAMTKGVLFLSAGNIHRAYASKNTEQVQGALRRLPLSGALFLAGFLAITGSPPFGPFISEFSILNGAFTAGKFISGGLFLGLLLVVFIGMGITVLKVVQGRVPHDIEGSDYRDSFLTVAPAFAFMAIVLLLGCYIPPALQTMLDKAVQFLGNQP
ncbi:MAG: proton-conducting transporter membrane subunit [Rectinemataceae bacterium]|nr:proton-conducting transporter membrane subunit [Rectinemataceae bacterium]